MTMLTTHLTLPHDPQLPTLLYSLAYGAPQRRIKKIQKNSKKKKFAEAAWRIKDILHEQVS
jgi:hypothetical protein